MRNDLLRSSHENISLYARGGKDRIFQIKFEDSLAATTIEMKNDSDLKSISETHKFLENHQYIFAQNENDLERTHIVVNGS